MKIIRHNLSNKSKSGEFKVINEMDSSEPFLSQGNVLIPYKERNGVYVKQIQSNGFLKNSLINIKVINAKKDCVYRLSYYDNGKNDKYLIQFEEVLNCDWSKNGNRNRFISIDFKPNLNQGIQSYVLLGNVDKTLSVLITVDTDVYEQNTGQSIIAWSETNSGYCWIINQNNYIYSDEVKKLKEVTKNSEGTLTQNSFFLSPYDEFVLNINGGQSNYKGAPRLNPLLSQCVFNFPEQVLTSRRTIVYEPIGNTMYEVPLQSIKSNTLNSPFLLNLFQIKKINESGFLHFMHMGASPLYTTISGSLSFIRRLRDEDTENNYAKFRTSLVLTNISNGPREETDKNQYLGTSMQSVESSPFSLNKDEFQVIDEEVLGDINGGLWAMSTIHVNKDIMLHPKATYAFRFQFSKISGESYNTLSNVGFKVISGSLSCIFDAAEQVRRDYGFRFEDVSNGDC